MKRNQKAFTLAEVLIVVAIIGVLVAISIPLFTGQLEKTRKATCAANMRAFKAVLSAEYLSGDGTWKYGVETTNTAESDQCKCPSGGIITYWQTSSGAFEVSCSKHDGMNSNTIPSIIDILISPDYKAHTIDSNAPSGNNNYTDKFVDALKNAGIDLSALGVNTWGYSTDTRTVNDQTYKYMLQFTSEDISSPSSNAKVSLMMRVRFDDNGKILYSIWTNTSITKKTSSGISYNTLAANGTELSYPSGTDKTDFDAMKKVYNKYAAQKNLPQLK